MSLKEMANVVETLWAASYKHGGHTFLDSAFLDQTARMRRLIWELHCTLTSQCDPILQKSVTCTLHINLRRWTEPTLAAYGSKSIFAQRGSYLFLSLFACITSHVTLLGDLLLGCNRQLCSQDLHADFDVNFTWRRWCRYVDGDGPNAFVGGHVPKQRSFTRRCDHVQDNLCLSILRGDCNLRRCRTNVPILTTFNECFH